MLESNILWVSEYNLTESLQDKPACLLMVISEPDKDVRFHSISDFITAANTLGSRCFFAIMSGERNYKFTKSHSIKDEKAYFFFRYGILIHQFNGKTTTEGLVDFTMSKTGIPFTTFDDYVTAQDFIEGHENVLVLYSNSLKGKLFDKFNSIASQMRDNISFGLCPDEEIALELDIESSPALVLYRNADKQKIFYKDSLKDSTEKDISSWLTYNMKPMFHPFNINNQKSYIGGLPVALFFTPVDIDAKNEAFKFISKLAAQYSNDLYFAQIDAVTGNRFMQSLGFSRYADPCVAILHYQNKKPLKYLYDEEAEWSFEDVSNFFGEFLDGKLKPRIKKSKLPENDKGPVFEVNSDTLNETIRNNTVILYYEPWDNVYNAFLKQFEEVAKEYLNRIKFTKINVAENDIFTGMRIKSTPAIVLYNKGEKILFKGELTKKELINFLKDELDDFMDL
ncbi:hypothetical protein TVAG_349600 [Trichomonas vaginalis G3]|uniref:protein disulfide-isomerase n=1 Tax=Trichomonas vaginalis (strain ATCC PRA-98 / G3) TaxID=412133 RepID=A2EMN7_TRIV3|nr:intramolecular oxidoreductase activity, transposing S-S bonds [Trichomonas vaginalis G3]EAY06107.1 hypothetical protein TVAG_349600 [Trichomonas vaginalis G3]KAI5497159.1 intramolecular oxidoreductase activity, transposing S-S bonds [Trichomonas vaginalis G3]|eukprot:XP_001318330.1 hypothetical protein [Trichomonas vaginalis G3]